MVLAQSGAQLLASLAESGAGARTAYRELQRQGSDMSLATVGRRLSELRQLPLEV